MNNKSIFLSIFKYFLGWRLILLLAAFLGTLAIVNFGGRFPYADRVLAPTGLPSWLWGFGNFDGVHYLRIAQDGYRAEFSQAFFPVYPFLIKIFNFLPKGNLDTNIYTDPSYFYTGMIISAVSFIVALYFLFKLWKDEYGGKVAQAGLLILITFPTAFYFGSVYSESIFLLLAVLTFWFARKDKFFLAGVVAALASATKIQGVFLFIFLAIELWSKFRSKPGGLKNILPKGILGLIVSPMGLVGYMYYLYEAKGDPIYFLTAQPAFGTGREGVPFITLPQVIYRYIKMVLTVSPQSLAFWNAFLELFITLVLVGALIYAFKKIKFSYWIFALMIVILPTMTGTLTSVPRYALMAFPLIPVFAKFNKVSIYIIIAQVLLEVVLVALFTRGYWVA